MGAAKNFFSLNVLTADTDRARLLYHIEYIVDNLNGYSLLGDLAVMDVISERQKAQLEALYKEEQDGNKAVVLGLLSMMKKKSDKQVEDFISTVWNRQPMFYDIFSRPLPEGESANSITMGRVRICHSSHDFGW